MLKKAGIVVAATAAGLLALSPLAFADDDESSDNSQSGGLLNLQNTNVQVPVQACNNSVLEGVVGVLAKDLSNEDSHEGSCDQSNEADNAGDDSDD